jgi:hypothetical protein
LVFEPERRWNHLFFKGKEVERRSKTWPKARKIARPLILEYLCRFDRIGPVVYDHAAVVSDVLEIETRTD